MTSKAKYRVGDLVTCHWEYIPPTPEWNPFIEGRPCIITKLRDIEDASKDCDHQVFYQLAILTQRGKIITRYLAEQNVKPYEAATVPVNPALPASPPYD